MQVVKKGGVGCYSLDGVPQGCQLFFKAKLELGEKCAVAGCEVRIVAVLCEDWNNLDSLVL